MAEMEFAGAGRSRLVLVVEDEDAVRQSAVETLKLLGYETIAASCSVEALAQLQRHHAQIDLLFTDVKMPGEMDGAELAFTVRSHWPDIAIIIVSGYFDPKISRLPMGCGFLAKPYRLPELKAMLALKLTRRASPSSTAGAGIAVRL